MHPTVRSEILLEDVSVYVGDRRVVEVRPGRIEVTVNGVPASSEKGLTIVAESRERVAVYASLATQRSWLDLPVGPYEVTLVRQGVKTSKDVTVVSGKTVDVDFVLK